MVGLTLWEQKFKRVKVTGSKSSLKCLLPEAKVPGCEFAMVIYSY